MSRQFESAARAWDVQRESESEVEGDRRDDREYGGRLELSLRKPTNGVDLTETDETFVLTVDVPGYESDDLEVRLIGDAVHVSGERSDDVDERDGHYIRRERRTRSLDRRVELPTAVDTEDVDARVNNGVLTVSLTKVENDRPRTIEIG